FIVSFALRVLHSFPTRRSSDLCLAGILMVVAYHMSEWRQFKSLLKGTRMDIIILLTTFLLTVFFDLVIAIEIGIVLSSLLFMKRDRKSTRLNSSHVKISYAVFC